MGARFLYDESMVRLHVLANSDSQWDQYVKMCVVKAIRSHCARISRRAKNARQAYKLLSDNCERIEKAAVCEARKQGFEGQVHAETGIFPFPDRVYAGELIPAGYYPAVRVRIGNAQGHNWWCVLYPQLCAVEEECARALASPEAVRFYSSIGRFIKGIMKGAGI